MLIIVIMSPTLSIIVVFRLILLRCLGFVLWPFVILSLLELACMHIFQSHMFAHGIVSEAYCLFVPHAFLCHESLRVLQFSVLLAVFARFHCHCFLFGFALFFARRIPAAQVAASLAALAALSTLLFVTVVFNAQTFHL